MRSFAGFLLKRPRLERFSSGIISRNRKAVSPTFTTSRPAVGQAWRIRSAEPPRGLALIGEWPGPVRARPKRRGAAFLEVEEAVRARRPPTVDQHGITPEPQAPDAGDAARDIEGLEEVGSVFSLTIGLDGNADHLGALGLDSGVAVLASDEPPHGVLVPLGVLIQQVGLAGQRATCRGSPRPGPSRAWVPGRRAPTGFVRAGDRSAVGIQVREPHSRGL